MLSIRTAPHHVGPAAASSVWAGAIGASSAVHACAILIVVALTAGIRPPIEPVPAALQNAPSPRIVFVAPDLPKLTKVGGGGGGGGGNRQSGQIRRAQSVGRDAATLRIARPIAPAGRTGADVAPLPGLLLDAKPLASGEVEQVGLPFGGVGFGTSQGPGSGGGVGTGTGTGIGPGRGPGLGDGIGGGTGGGVYRPGGGVTAPQLLAQVRAKYTNGALERRIQGSVVLELVVSAQGTPTAIRVVRSLDPDGLDKEAIGAVEQWQFAPGKYGGRPVAVLVTVVLDFTIY